MVHLSEGSLVGRTGEWAMAGADEFTIWKTTSAGAYSSSLVGAVSGASLA